MSIIDHSAEARTWAEEHFGETMFSDGRRVERVITIGAAMAANPGASIPRLFTRWYDTKAAYTFFGHEEATPEMIQAGHRDLVREAMRDPGTYLLLEDTTEVDYSKHAPIPGLGPIGNSTTTTQGFLLHSVLAVGWPQGKRQDPRGSACSAPSALDPAASAEEAKPAPEPRPGVAILGLCDQHYYVRRPKPPEEPDRSTARKGRERESQLWEWATQRTGPSEEGARWVRICDAGADVYEHLQTCAEYGHGYVIRAAQDRTLAQADGCSRAGRLYHRVRTEPALGSFEVALYARKGRPARTATVSVSAIAVQIRSPQRPGGRAGALPPIACTCVRVWEPDPPEGQEAVEWILLCDATVTTLDEARECATQYATRGLIEEFHKALKTGLGAERLQVETAHRLFAAIAVMSVVALRLLEVREVARRDPEAPAAQAGLDAIEMKVLETVTGRRLATVADVVLAIGRLGGHLNRKRDGMPGWQTLWHGYKKLQLLSEGVRLAKRVEEFG